MIREQSLLSRYPLPQLRRGALAQRAALAGCRALAVRRRILPNKHPSRFRKYEFRKVLPFSVSQEFANRFFVSQVFATDSLPMTSPGMWVSNPVRATLTRLTRRVVAECWNHGGTGRGRARGKAAFGYGGAGFKWIHSEAPAWPRRCSL